jgi:serine/threonine-protein kinase
MSRETLERVDAYVLGPAFAGGGTATVHLGRRTTAPSPVNARTMAVKRLRPELAGDPQLVELLVREAHVTSRLRHANLVSVSDVVQHRGELLLVSEYVHGVSLRTAMRAPVPLGVAVAIARDVLAGLHAAHVVPAGIVHRDVAPENVVVGVDGSARLVDFGIAWALGRGRYTGTGDLRGKVGYLSSEHVNGQAVDARADVYSLAAVLWEMLAGRPLFDAAPGPALLEQVMLGFHDPVRRYRPEVSPALDALLGRALSHQREQRPATAQVFERELLAAASPVVAASTAEVAAWIEEVAAAEIAERAAQLAAFERAAAAATAAGTGTGTAEDVTEVSGPPAILRNLARAPAPMSAVRRRAIALAVGLAGAALIALAAVAHRHAKDVADSASSAEDGAWPVTALTDPAPLVSSAPSAPSAPGTDGADSAAPSAPSAPASSSPPLLATPARAPQPPRRRSRGAPPPSCDPPYVTGPDGRRTYKRECVL